MSTQIEATNEPATTTAAEEVKNEPEAVDPPAEEIKDPKSAGKQAAAKRVER